MSRGAEKLKVTMRKATAAARDGMYVHYIGEGTYRFRDQQVPSELLLPGLPRPPFSLGNPPLQTNNSHQWHAPQCSFGPQLSSVLAGFQKRGKKFCSASDASSLARGVGTRLLPAVKKRWMRHLAPRKAVGLLVCSNGRENRGVALAYRFRVPGPLVSVGILSSAAPRRPAGEARRY